YTSAKTGVLKNILPLACFRCSEHKIRLERYFAYSNPSPDRHLEHDLAGRVGPQNRDGGSARFLSAFLHDFLLEIWGIPSRAEGQRGFSADVSRRAEPRRRRRRKCSISRSSTDNGI